MDKILIVNVGSTSFKFQLLDSHSLDCLAKGGIDRVFYQDSLFRMSSKKTGELSRRIDTQEGYSKCIEKMMEALCNNNLINDVKDISAVGFKTVLAGNINYPVLVTDEVIEQMRHFNFVAPAHNPPYIEALNIFRESVPEIPLVAVFEPGFHRTIPDFKRVYPFPKEIRERYCLQKNGFHGASHGYVAWKISQQEGIGSTDRIISCHLGGSSSICAIKGGESTDTSMGFSPQSGLPMNNRNGDLDVFSVLYLMEEENMSPSEMRELLSTESGLKGISGISEDVRVLKESGSDDAMLALNHYAYSVKKYIGAYIAEMNGLDVITFSGGIGENDPDMRRMICSELDFFGIRLDDERNRQYTAANLPSDGIDISDPLSEIRIIVLPANEEHMVAMQTIKTINKEVAV